MKSILITGGAGFIGTNASEYFADKGYKVIVFDDLSRKGAEKNLEYLQSTKPDIEFVKGSVVDDFKKLCELAERVDVILHLAAQVAVTTSVEDPRHDFNVNALGSFNVLEAARLSTKKPICMYSSTNKVYGGMESVKVKEEELRYSYDGLDGISEDMQLDFHSPYGCSNGTADQYFIDYSRIFGLKTAVFRQSCIYGPRQFGIEDQGWVAWFCIAAHMGKNLTIFGDGKQVRDVLNVKDLVKLYDLTIENIDKVSGQAFNTGGGKDKTLSLLEFLKIIEDTRGEKVEYSVSDWRPGDQKVYISDISKLKRLLGWEPEITPEEGVKELMKWIEENEELFE